MRNVNELHPELQEKIRKLKMMCREAGLPLGIGECVRTVAEQDALYAQGRTKPGVIVTYAPGSSYSSQHQWGIACDFFRNVVGREYDNGDHFFERVGLYAKGLGLAWGGDWIRPVDMPHLYLPYWGDTPAILKRQYGTPEAFMATWKGSGEEKLEVDGWCGVKTVTRLQKHFGTPVDGVITNQWEFYRDSNPGLVAVEWSPNPVYGSTVVRKLQKMVGATVDGIIGPETIGKMQEHFGTPVDGFVSGPSAVIKALQEWLNNVD